MSVAGRNVSVSSCALLGVFIALMVLAANPAAADDVTFTCTGSLPHPCQFCGIEDTLCVLVSIDSGLDDVRGASFVFEFDPTIVKPVSVEAWGLAAGPCPTAVYWLNETSYVSTLEVDMAGLGCSFTGPGAILRLCFTGTEPNLEGLSDLQCQSSVLRDSSNHPIPHGCGSATLVNVCAIPVEPQSWSGLKHRFRPLLLRHE